MKFSLIVATLGRAKPLTRLLNSLKEQTCRNFEVIVVDQNIDNRVDPIIKEFNDHLKIVHLKSEPGLSRARNMGLEVAKGQIITFPDDDCWYMNNLLLDTIHDELNNNPVISGVSGITVDENENVSVSRFAIEEKKVNKFNAWRTITSATLFLKRKAVKSTNGFDEELGVGANTKWGAAEDIDYALKIIKNGYDIKYAPAIKIGHPNPMQKFDERVIQRGLLYGGGVGRVCRKHNYPTWFFAYFLFRPIVGCVISLLRLNIKKFRYHLNVVKGRALGWLG